MKVSNVKNRITIAFVISRDMFMSSHRQKTPKTYQKLQNTEIIYNIIYNITTFVSKQSDDRVFLTSET